MICIWAVLYVVILCTYTGYPAVSGATLLEKRCYARDHLDSLRTALIHEPRGHNDMYGALPVEADREDADFAVLFLHKRGFEFEAELVYSGSLV